MVSGILNGMTLRIDKAGRIVVPKSIRDRLGLGPGAGLELSESPAGLLLKPVRRRPSLVQDGELLVHQGALPKDYDWNRLVEDSREERLRTVAGW
jgi:AbrB family looped-hinge helix DNA binding protein